MDNPINIFGKQSPKAVAGQILNSDVLNANPSPATPQTAIPNDVAKNYARLLFSAYEIRKLDKDETRLGWIQTVIDKADEVYSELALNADETTEFGPPGTPPPPATSAAPPPQTMGGPPPPQAGPPAPIPAGGPLP